MSTSAGRSRSAVEPQATDRDPQPYSNHKGGESSPVATGCSTSPRDAAARAPPAQRAEPRRPALEDPADQSGQERSRGVLRPRRQPVRVARRRASRDVDVGLRNPCGSRSIGRPATSGSATSVEPVRRDRLRARRPGRDQLGLERREGFHAFRGTAPSDARDPIVETDHSAATVQSSAATCTGGRRFPRSRGVRVRRRLPA